MLSSCYDRRGLHHLNTCLVGAALILLIVPSITTPWSGVHLLRAYVPGVDIQGGHPVVRFGSHGYCVTLLNSPK
jgi:hypothetical protein